MKSLILSALVWFATTITVAAQTEVQLYHPKADAQQAIDKAVVQAKKEHKHIFLQVGGNWCSWCIRFHHFLETNDTLKLLLEKNYISVHINYSPENHNDKLLASLGFPQRFGFPVFVILDENGQRIHTQNSSYLEEEKGYNAQKVAAFFEQWSPQALEPERYKN